ncbi:ras GTPase-activating-like protein [Scheffersomyces xylosifermentans]|uniref:ras GTPase-activating-like protein n=1 Tax=Scheffersomyces xylosifermentans TaxID=1304137 RepID=UPI00315C6AA1
MASPTRNNVAARYLEVIHDGDGQLTPVRLPLQPTLSHNSYSVNRKESDLDVLAKELNVTPSSLSPTKTALLRTRFESPSATVLSFKTPRNKTSSNNSSKNSSPIKRNNFDINSGTPKKNVFDAKPNLAIQDSDEQPSWANKNYSENLNRSPASRLSPLKQQMETPSRTQPRPFLSSPSNSTSKDSPGYEYLCRIQAIKNWLQQVLQEQISQQPVELISYIRNGILLAKLANVILPTKRKVFTNDSKLEFRHTENINRFFHLLDFMNVPDLFTFELTDLYDAKNVPKVWFCLHALSYLMNKSDQRYPKIENLVDRIEFTEDDIRSANRALVGAGLPNFSSADNGEDTSAGENSYMNKVAAESPIKLNIVELPAPPPPTPPPSQEPIVQSQPNPFQEEPSATPTITRFQEELTRKVSPVIVTSPVLTSSECKRSDYYTPELESNIVNIIKLQSLARGANFRYSMFVDKIMLKSYSDELTHFFSIIRGNASRRKTVHRHRGDLLVYKDEIVELQSMIRRKLLNQSKPDINNTSQGFCDFQSVIRGVLERRRLRTIIKQLDRQHHSVTLLQAKIRMNSIHKKASIVMKYRSLVEPSIVELQSISRRRLQERRASTKLIDEDSIVELQTLIRARNVKRRIQRVRSTVKSSMNELVEFQSIARGGLSRSRLCNNVLITLLYEDIVLNELYAKVRGNNVRKEIAAKKKALKRAEKSSIIPLQSAFRGIYCRFEREITLDDIYCEVDNVIQLQAVIRGRRIRQETNNVELYYQKNVQKVIKAQSILRRNLAQKAYKTLLNKKNPPLSVIRRFAYLLSDNDSDYSEELELSEAKDKIIEKSKHNEELENQIENLDIKLSLLDKNKITVEEFVKHKNKYKTYKPMNSSNGNVTAKYLDSLNKSSRERIELYQSLFYFLQTKPIYFVRLYKMLSTGKSNSKFLDDLQTFIVSLFPVKDSSITHHSREEYFFMKLIFGLMQNDIENNSRTISDLTKTQSSYWIEYFLHFNNHTFQRQHLKQMVGNFVSSIFENDELDFESDPSEIYEAIVEQEHKVNGFSDRPRGISPQQAIKEEDVSSTFVANLMSLREVATDFMNLLEVSVDAVPLHVKLICKNAYKLSQLQFPEKTDQQHLSVAGVVFIKHYVAAILQYPENFGYNSKDYHVNKSRNNLKHLSRVMLQVFSMKPFSDSFLKPLNDFISSSSEMARNLILALIDVKDLDYEYELDDYDDIVNHERPKLTMNVSNMISLEKIVSQNIDVMAPTSDDQLYKVTSQLDNVINSADDFVTLTELGFITLNLNPTTKEDSLADSKYKSLFTQAKRCLLYIIRIQEGDGLLELLISGIKPADEIKFKEIVAAERKDVEESSANAKKKPYYRTSLGDLTALSYHDLKKMALEIILKLELQAQLTRKNSFQELLNQIAVDIKTKDTQRVSRKQQLEIASKTLSKLNEKEMFLKKQLSDYNKHIESILSELQSKPKDRKIFNIIPVFSKQYFYHRELRKNNRLPQFGSYKYSARKLMEQNIIKDFGGLVNRASSSSSRLDFMFSCHQAGKFVIEAANGSVTIPGALSTISLDDLLNYQYENKQTIETFDGMVTFDTNNLTGFIFRKFYDTKKD